MKLLALVASQTVFASVFAGVVHVPRAGEYDTLDGCDEVGLAPKKWGAILKAQCWVQQDGQWRVSDTTLDLNSCIANVDGKMVGVAEGHFAKTCDKLKVNRDHPGSPVTLTATCKGPHGKVDASTTLDFIKNDQGILACFKIAGDSALWK
ncbi:hypothetical protein F4803DRAFT_571655 [Xylaria telfairii]|nr:hypothetical protein F4803DRAFT_571655 [Xylaria telfairii]